MSGSVFVVDAGGVPLMPMSSAFARKLLNEGKAQRRPHPALTIIQLTRHIDQPQLWPVVAAIRVHLRTAEVFLLVERDHATRPLLHVLIDLATDLPRRLRRRAGHRRRRHARQRYHGLGRQGRPAKLRRPSLARSSWGATFLRAQRKDMRASTGRTYTTPLFRWRAEAIVRTLNMLRQSVPIHHVLLLDARHQRFVSYQSLSSAQYRNRLVRSYGVLTMHGSPVPVCAFCGATDRAIDIEHLLPTSRGGANSLDNMALACRRCNQRKGNNTPEEAQMPLQLQHDMHLRPKGRRRPYIASTLTALRAQLRRTKDTESVGQLKATTTITQGLYTLTQEVARFPQTVIAYPVPRPRKQRFIAYNYPPTTAPRADFVRTRRAVKRLVRVNRALAINRQNRHQQTVISIQESTSAHDLAETILIRPGMLCAVPRAGKPVVGIVSAIHSSGRLTLRVPVQANTYAVQWQSLAVSPRRSCRVLSTDRVVFLPVPDMASEEGKARG